eukprot:4520453-Amphidinium_carterae.1
MLNVAVLTQIEEKRVLFVNSGLKPSSTYVRISGGRTVGIEIRAQLKNAEPITFHRKKTMIGHKANK